MKGGRSPETALHSAAPAARRAFGAAAQSGGTALHGLLQRGDSRSAGACRPRLLAVEMGEHGGLQRLAGAQDRLDIAFLRAVEPAAEQEQLGEPVDVVQRRTKIVRQRMKVGRERVTSVRPLVERMNQVV